MRENILKWLVHILRGDDEEAVKLVDEMYID